MPTDDLDRVLVGQCIHGHTEQRQCGTCAMTRYLAGSLRHMLTHLFGDSRGRVAATTTTETTNTEAE